MLASQIWFIISSGFSTVAYRQIYKRNMKVITLTS